MTFHHPGRRNATSWRANNTKVCSRETRRFARRVYARSAARLAIRNFIDSASIALLGTNSTAVERPGTARGAACRLRRALRIQGALQLSAANGHSTYLGSTAQAVPIRTFDSPARQGELFGASGGDALVIGGKHFLHAAAERCNSAAIAIPSHWRRPACPRSQG